MQTFYKSGSDISAYIQSNLSFPPQPEVEELSQCTARGNKLQLVIPPGGVVPETTYVLRIKVAKNQAKNLVGMFNQWELRFLSQIGYAEGFPLWTFGNFTINPVSQIMYSANRALETKQEGNPQTVISPTREKLNEGEAISQPAYSPPGFHFSRQEGSGSRLQKRDPPCGTHWKEVKLHRVRRGTTYEICLGTCDSGRELKFLNTALDEGSRYFPVAIEFSPFIPILSAKADPAAYGKLELRAPAGYKFEEINLILSTCRFQMLELGDCKLCGSFSFPF